MKIRVESTFAKRYENQSLATLFLLTLLFLFGQSQLNAQEAFKPGTVSQNTKEVQVYLPFHDKPKTVSIEFVDDISDHGS